MQINTKYFSSMDYEEDEVVTFPRGIFGFEEHKNYIIINFDNENNNLLCLQSLEDENLAFILISISNFLPDYIEEISSSIPNTYPLDTLCVYGVCVIKEPISQSTINLKCPILVNVDSREATQIILENNTYPFKHSFSNLLTVKEDCEC